MPLPIDEPTHGENTTLDYLIEMRHLGRQVHTTWDEPQFEGSDEKDLLDLLSEAVNLIHDMRRSQ